jgi:hypothetical protein
MFWLKCKRNEYKYSVKTDYKIAVYRPERSIKITQVREQNTVSSKMLFEPSRQKWMNHMCCRRWRGTSSKSTGKSFTNTKGWYTASVSLLCKTNCSKNSAPKMSSQELNRPFLTRNWFLTKNFCSFKWVLYNAVDTAIGYWLDNGDVRVRVTAGSWIFFSPRRPGRLWGPPTLPSSGYRGLFPGIYSDPGLMLTNDLQLVSRSRRRGSIFLLSPTPSWLSAKLVKHRNNFIFYLYCTWEPG